MVLLFRTKLNINELILYDLQNRSNVFTGWNTYDKSVHHIFITLIRPLIIDDKS